MGPHAGTDRGSNIPQWYNKIRQMAGTLFVVATPIGNLEDITLRALRILREADLIAAEDTRRTSRLLGHYGIQTRLISLHEHNERSRIPALLARLGEGRSIALVTDAGTPGASDPGMLLVRAAREAGQRVEAVPGPSAITTALSVAGQPFVDFAFAGFPPVRSKDRKQWLAAVASKTEAVVFFEAPHRIRRTLTELAIIFGDRPITVCRELTKVHEEVFTASAAEILGRLGDPRGEFTLVVGPQAAQPATDASGGESVDDRVAREIGQITDNEPGTTRREHLRRIADRLGLKVSDVYRSAERLKNLSNDQQ